MLERILNEPLVFFGGCLIWLPLSIWVISLVHWMVLGDIDSVLGIIGIGVAIGIGIVALDPPDPRLTPLLLLVSVLTIIFFPLVQQAMNRHALHLIELEAVQRAYESLRERPGNAASQIRVAKALYGKGLVTQAIAVAESALQTQPPILFEDEHKMVAQWRMLSRKVNFSQRIACLNCGMSNEPSFVYCQRCGSEYLLDYIQSSWIGGRTVKRLLATWIASVAALAGIPAAAMALPPMASLPIMAALAIVVVVVMWRAFVVEVRPAR